MPRPLMTLGAALAGLFGAILLVLLLGLVSPVSAQEPEAFADGDVLWAFAQEEPFFDERIAMAFATLVDAELAAGAGDARIVAVRQQPPDEIVPLSLAPASDVPLLFAAAGYPDASFVEVERCAVWAEPGAEATAEQIAGALGAALAGLGVEVQPCEQTSSPEGAHLLVWTHGGEVPVIPSRDQPTFLAGQPSASPPPAEDGQAGGTGGSAEVAPPDTGNAGLEGETAAGGWLLAGSLATLAVVLGARRATRGEAARRGR